MVWNNWFNKRSSIRIILNIRFSKVVGQGPVVQVSTLPFKSACYGPAHRRRTHTGLDAIP